jgi:hypothetical protein
MKVLAGIVAGLAVLYGLILIPWTGGNAVKIRPPADPTKLLVEGPRGRVALEKNGEAWRLTEPVPWPADEEAVQRLTAGLRNLVLESEVSRRPETLDRYELDDAKAVRLTAWGKEASPFTISLGKNAGFTDRAYVLFGKEPAVYLASGLSRDEADLPPARWRDRRVFDRTDIVRLRVTRGPDVLTLEKSSAGWTVNGASADLAKSDAFVSDLRTLAADDLVDPPGSDDLKKYGLDAPSAEWEVSFSTGAPVSLAFGTGDPRPVRRDGEKTLFLVPGYRAVALDKSSKDFAAPSFH